MNKAIICVLLIIINSIITRSYFTLATGQPVSVDAWQLIKNAEIGIKLGHIDRSIENIDNYNINWPLSQIFGILISIIFGVEIKDAMRLGFPLIASISPLLLFTLSLKLTKNNLTAFLASLFLANYTYNIYFTSGITKETFSYPFFIFSLLCFLLIFKNKKYIIPFFISSIVLLISHHFTLAVFYIVLLFFLTCYLVYSIAYAKKINKGIIISFALFTFFILLYYNFYVNREVFSFLSFSDILIFLSYQAFILLIFVKTKIININSKVSNKIFIIFFSFIFLYILNLFFNIFPYNYIYSTYFLISSISYIILIFFILLAYKHIKLNEYSIMKLFLLTWPAAIFAFYLYAFFGANYLLSITLSKRLLDFLFPSTFLLISLYLIKNKKLTTVFSMLIILLFLTQIYFIYPLKLNYTGYQWLYSKEEIEAFNWLKEYYANNVIIGDVKASYALSYFGLSVNPYDSYLYFFEDKKVKNALIVLYYEMPYNGFVLTDYGEKLKDEWKTKMYEKSIIFSNYRTFIFHEL